MELQVSMDNLDDLNERKMKKNRKASIVESFIGVATIAKNLQRIRIVEEREPIMLRSLSVHGDELYSYSCDETTVRYLSQMDELLCPACRNAVRFKKGVKVYAHFAHKPNTECVVRYYKPETESHIHGKQVLFNWLSNRFPESSLGLEVFIPGTGQIADILVSNLPGDWKENEGLLNFNIAV